MEDFRKKYNEYINLDSSKMNQFLLVDQAMNFLKIKSENPNLAQGKICKMIGTSDSTMRRIRKELGIPSPYRYNNRCNRKNKKKDNKNLIDNYMTKDLMTKDLMTKDLKINNIREPIKKLKNISRDFLASGGVNSGGVNSGAINPTNDNDPTNDDVEIKTGNQMSRFFHSIS